jgi:class 3 adenylate cyclase
MTCALLLVAALALAAALGVVVARSRREIAELRRRLDVSASQLQNLQLSFSRFAPDAIIERIITDGDKVKGERVEVSVLFADLVGFTALSERVEPDVLVGILNGYFERMSEAITSNRGHVSTFIGDGILAFFGALAPNPWQSDDAVYAALAMREGLDAYNLELHRQGLPALRVGIGLHRGTGIAGLVGSRDLMEFTIVGRTVNVAARVQDLTRRLGADVIVTEALREKLAPRFALRPLPDSEVKGVAEPLRIHAVDGLREARGEGRGAGDEGM